MNCVDTVKGGKTKKEKGKDFWKLWYNGGAPKGVGWTVKKEDKRLLKVESWKQAKEEKIESVSPNYPNLVSQNQL